VESFPVPGGIVFEKINSQTGASADASEKGISEAFLQGASPNSTLTDEIKGLFR
jgi:hypothetical protein